MRQKKQPLTGRAALLATLSEAEWQRQVCEWAMRAGWRIYHTADSRRSHAGFPDLVLVKPGRFVIFAELKTVSGRISTMQRVWLDELQQCPGARAYVWRPDMEDEVKVALNAPLSMFEMPLAAGRSDAAEAVLNDDQAQASAHQSTPED